MEKTEISEAAQIVNMTRLSALVSLWRAKAQRKKVEEYLHATNILIAFVTSRSSQYTELLESLEALGAAKCAQDVRVVLEIDV